jgi:acetoacetyl-CoA synthetase
MKLWQPSEERSKATNVAKFIGHLNQQSLQSLWLKEKDGHDFHSLYEWSCRNPETFWLQFLEFSGIRYEGSIEPTLEKQTKFQDCRWFPNLKLNFAENLLEHAASSADEDAIIFWGEQSLRSKLSWQELKERVAAVAEQLEELGVQVGDRVAAITPNAPDAIIAMLATVAIGAVWSSASPDFGTQGILDRFGQIQPKVLICCDAYQYKGIAYSLEQKLTEIVPILAPEAVLIMQHLKSNAPLTPETLATTAKSDWLTTEQSSKPIPYQQLPFNHPLVIMFSSGTTGKPKCIVHGAGGTLLEHKKELLLHTDLQAGQRILYATTCGWMMWNWLLSALSVKATVMLYDGFPMLNDGAYLFDYIDQEKIDVFGTSAGFISALNKQGTKPKQTHSLTSLKTILSTGSPLVPESFDFVYEHIKSDLCLSSISGGTDIIGCFALGSPTLPVHRGELQTRSLGLAVDVVDDSCESVKGTKGELVCKAPFPSMPIYFWNDPDGSRYHNAYFSRFENIWCHGDYVELTSNNGMVFYGRSDAVLNPGGVRIGTAEIYRQLETIPAIIESVVVGQRWQNDERVVLFVRIQPGVTLDDELKKTISSTIRTNASPRHVPAKIIAVTDIPRTRSGKITELAIKNIIHGEPVKNTEALANPESLRLFENIAELQS